jgi:NAD(P)-dependent dehydrogenase (short-subunit alcohol dehydrogenase family)
MPAKPIAIIAGVGNNTGTGAACAREFKEHRVAVIGRRAESLHALVKELESQGFEALAVPLSSYARGPIEAAFRDVRSCLTNVLAGLRADSGPLAGLACTSRCLEHFTMEQHPFLGHHGGRRSEEPSDQHVRSSA